MKRVVLGAVMLVSACQAGGVGPAETSAGNTNSVFREFLVIGSSMTFEDCRARGGLIIRDAGSPMVACDPSVTGNPTPLSDIQTDERAAGELEDMSGT